MRKIVAGFASSLDGYIEGPNGEIDWILIDDKIDFSDYFNRFDAFLFGRKTYEAVLPMFSGSTKGISYYVLSQTLKNVHENFTLLSGDAKAQLEALRSGEGKDIAVYGGANLLASLLDWGLVDEISVSVIPVMLGGGKPMVSMLREKVWLQFISSRRYDNGTIVINYAVKF